MCPRGAGRPRYGGPLGGLKQGFNEEVDAAGDGGVSRQGSPLPVPDARVCGRVGSDTKAVVGRECEQACTTSGEQI